MIQEDNKGQNDRTSEMRSDALPYPNRFAGTSSRTSHPWMASSAPGQLEAMLREIGAASPRELFEQIPADHFRKAPLELPAPITSEVELRRVLRSKLSKNRDCEQNLSFLGAGVWQHFVPGVVDEIVSRTEFSTNIWGSAQSDVGRNQAWFEFSSQLGALLNMDVVQLPVYSWGCAAGHAIRMAARMTGRNKILVSALSDPERLAVIRTYCGPRDMERNIELVTVACDPKDGRLDIKDLNAKLDRSVAAVYFENPAYLGTLETRAAAIAAAARKVEAETIVGVDPLSLGIFAPPADYGADIVVGPTQPLGVHMNGGGGTGGFIATHDNERYVRQYNGFLVSIDETITAGEYAFGLSHFHQTSYGSRESGNDWTGTSVYLWAVANAAYMSLLGPKGFEELGALILARARFAARRLGAVRGVRILWPENHFKEFVVNFDGTGKSVREINDALRADGIFGGKDISNELPQFGQSSLFCVTEIHGAADIERLVTSLERIL
ncbi:MULTISPECIES: aminomethyl-transferring glycine dehydrogenase subunit GcvPA [unclassified Mesorhizobium]|uniref:aminomethyl-transferring glycine dehydrogenase subunit GcvPA n=1 Tax=unclassified Mesorhizobium TaxID=325217 RepID=UPI00241594E0|nr:MULTISPECIES: aminomethyl-transferring glycine dehydrogenase subunit GcvPA [unclassified Mesorhizobium]MDG4890102.1 aminomethyl-transferring glycine dehydrogenase subunit GcvPA [Mesorhizobium sp. WSM4887]MDG4904244.1 aminomethyl-transferring glycine dehydrogenase subunit GcvPA [Mesorhizobium sp. WSM4962]MDG4909271.1 aminomethyl-transferring glycine dehydrogenase subunit GcvPA [Mesorhizobium sp. WSM4898]MDG4921895.1 aminomethyl-transferring glycine dehydrogenase subunit GcvPA [Mesorhizobium s